MFQLHQISASSFAFRHTFHNLLSSIAFLVLALENNERFTLLERSFGDCCACNNRVMNDNTKMISLAPL